MRIDPMKRKAAVVLCRPLSDEDLKQLQTAFARLDPGAMVMLPREDERATLSAMALKNWTLEQIADVAAAGGFASIGQGRLMLPVPQPSFTDQVLSPITLDAKPIPCKGKAHLPEDPLGARSPTWIGTIHEVGTAEICADGHKRLTGWRIEYSSGGTPWSFAELFDLAAAEGKALVHLCSPSQAEPYKAKSFIEAEMLLTATPGTPPAGDGESLPPRSPRFKIGDRVRAKRPSPRCEVMVIEGVVPQTYPASEAVYRLNANAPWRYWLESSLELVEPTTYAQLEAGCNGLAEEVAAASIKNHGIPRELLDPPPGVASYASLEAGRNFWVDNRGPEPWVSEICRKGSMERLQAAEKAERVAMAKECTCPTNGPEGLLARGCTCGAMKKDA